MGQIVPAAPQDEARRQQLFRQLASLPPDVREFIGQQYGSTQITVLPLPYWSAVRFQATRAAGPPATFTIDTTTRTAFAYARGQSPQIAGFPASYGNATEAETNLLRQNETRDNSDVWIWGLAAHLTPDSEPALARRVWRDTDVQISLNGTQSIPLGRLEMFPGAGGLYGAGVTYLKSPANDTAGPSDAEGGIGAQMGFVNNGYPAAGNFFRLPQPFKWSAVGSAGSDSSLNINCTPRRIITETAVARTAVPVVVDVTPGAIDGFTPPAETGDPGTFVDVIWHLICVAVSKRSVNT
jgi:hypothetical protein